MDPSIWRACAGTSVKIPTLNSRVYYFPQGHAEQSSSPPILSPLVSSIPMILSRVLAVKFLADPSTDEVFARIALFPLARVDDTPVDGDAVAEDEGEVASFAKVLTASDANNGGGFSVPRFCADAIFPALNYREDPPVQTLSVRDVHGEVWEFRHIYRGTPRRHLLTTGWSKFVNQKMLIAGDSVVFMKNKRTGELFVGVRRSVRASSRASSDYGGRWNCTAKPVKVDECGGERDGFSRNGRGRVSAESVAKAAELAAQGKVFEIVYYPKAGWGDFVVKAELVEESMKVFWTAGMRVKMAMDSDDLSRTTWYQGTVSSAKVPENGPWRGSPWRMLQVTWDEPENLKTLLRVSPWQVEYVVPSPSLHPAYPFAKKFRVSQNMGFLPEGGREREREGDQFFPLSGLSNSMMAHFNPPLLNFNSVPAGMQGARQNQICARGLSKFTDENNTHMTPNVKKTVSTELSIGSSQSDSLSPNSQSSAHSYGAEVTGNRGYNSTTKVRNNSFQLFGKTIQMKEPSEGCFDDVGSVEDVGSC